MPEKEREFNVWCDDTVFENWDPSVMPPPPTPEEVDEWVKKYINRYGENGAS